MDADNPENGVLIPCRFTVEFVRDGDIASVGEEVRALRVGEEAHRRPRAAPGVHRLRPAVRNIARGVICSMIVSFKDKDTEKLWLGEFVRRLDGIRKQALMRLGRLEAATSLGDLAGLAGNRLEAQATQQGRAAA